MRQTKPNRRVRAISATAPVGLLLALLALPAHALEAPSNLSFWDVGFYTFTSTCIIFFSISMLLLRAYTWLSYAVYGVLTLLLIASLDGTLAYLRDGDVWWMGYAPLLIGALAVGYGYLHLAFRLESPHWLAATRPFFVLYGVLALALIPAYLLMDSVVPLYAALNTLMLLMVAAQVLPPLTWTNLNQGQHRLAIIWPVLTGLVGVSAYSVHFLGSGFSRETLDAVNRLIYLLHLSHLFVFVGFVVADQIRERRQALQQAEVAAREAAEAALALERAEREFSRVQALAAERTQRLATASHDLKQPIAALRQALSQYQAQATSADPTGNRRILDAIDYLDQLAGTYLDLGTQELDKQDAEQLRDHNGHERVSIGLLFSTIASMFSEDAQAAEIELCVSDSPTELQIAPLAATRALSNLLNNAILHSGGSRVQVDAQHQEAAVRLEVRDNGCGMDAQTVADAMQIRARGVDSEGSGLGLPIVAALADEHGWQLSVDSEPGVGTCAALTIPLTSG